MIRRIVILFVAVLMAAVSCKRPPSMEYYVYNDGSGQYEYELDFSDSLAVYDLSFYTRPEKVEHPSGFPLRIYMTSPSGQTFVENVYYSFGESAVVPYRMGLAPVEYGKWILSARTDADFITGLGLIAATRE